MDQDDNNQPVNDINIPIGVSSEPTNTPEVAQESVMEQPVEVDNTMTGPVVETEEEKVVQTQPIEQVQPVEQAQPQIQEVPETPVQASETPSEPKVNEVAEETKENTSDVEKADVSFNWKKPVISMLAVSTVAVILALVLSTL